MQLVDKIRRYILSENDSNIRIKEQLLVEKFGGSRTPIRDALKHLELEGLIERRQKRGITLRKYSPKEISDLYDVRGALEMLAGEQAAKNATDEDCEYLKRIQRKLSVETGNIEMYYKCAADDFAFHRKIVEMSNNKPLAELLDRYLVISQTFAMRTRVRTMKSARIQSVTHEIAVEHKEIIAALQKRDSNLLAKLLRKHCLTAKKRIISELLDFDFE